jgi:hypothetical protein
MSQAWIGKRHIITANEGDLDGGKYMSLHHIALCETNLIVSSLTFFRNNSHPLSTGSRGFSIFDAGKSSGHSHEVCFQSYRNLLFSFLLSISEW